MNCTLFLRRCLSKSTNEKLETASYHIRGVDLLKAVTVNGTNYSISSSGGNPTNWYNGSKTYTGLTWQQGRQLAGLTVDGTSVSYEYDADGIRTKMVTGDVTYEFVTQGGKLMRETATNSSAVYVMDFIYDNVGRPFAVKFSKNGGSSFTTFYYVLNLQGDVVAITKADGTVVAKYTYDAWGNLTSLINANGTEIVNRTTGTAIAFWNPLTYRGYIRDRETGFYYLQSRYYDPANHRFINADRYVSTDTKDIISNNMFSYCSNNPAIYYDPDGYNSQVIDLGGGWYCRIDAGNESTGTKRHIHVWKNGESYAQNDDGSPHDKGNNSSGKLPRKIQKRLEKKTGWDYNGNRDAFFELTEITYPVPYTKFTYADGTSVCVAPTYVGCLEMPVSSSVDAMESYYYKTDSTCTAFNGAAGGFVAVTPIITHFSLPVISFGVSFAPAMLIF